MTTEIIRNDILVNWTKKDKRTLVHKTEPNTQIQLKSAHPYLRHNPARYTVMVKGLWVTDYNGQRGPITEFRSLLAAIDKADKLLEKITN
jgi:hypothetical protein